MVVALPCGADAPWLLLPDRLPTVVPLVCDALHFEHVSGNYAVGQHVRDAACYVCWAFARAYAPDVLEPFVDRLATALIQVAVYDREINCRRAAAAAVQEHVGRQGTFPNGIEVVTIADYWTLSVRRNAYLHVAPRLAALGSYRQYLIDHLVERKLLHQDLQVRLLAGAALAALAEEPSDATIVHLNGVVLPALLARVLDTAAPSGSGTAPAAGRAGGAPSAVTVHARHGAVVAIASLVSPMQAKVSTENQNAVRNLVPSLEKARAYRGRGGEIVRQASFVLLARVAAATSWPFKEATCVRYLQTIDECARHTTDSIQVAAADALRDIARLRFTPELCNKCADAYIQGLQKPDETVSARRGYVLCLGALPSAVHAARCSDITAALCREARGENLPGGADMEDPQTRQYAVLSLGRILLERADGRPVMEGAESAGSDVAPSSEDIDTIVAALAAAMRDYAVDRRGDVGSWVREVGIEVIAALLLAQRVAARAASPRVPRLGGTDAVTQLVAMLLQQAVEKIDRLRDRAFLLLYAVVCNGGGTPASLIEHPHNRVCHGEAYEFLGLDDCSGLGSSTVDTPGAAWAPKHVEILEMALRGAAAAAEVPAALTSASAASESLTATAAIGGADASEPASGSGAAEVAIQGPGQMSDRAILRAEQRAPGLVDRAAASAAVFDAVVPLLGTEAYRPAVALGLIVSMGGLTESTALEAKRALMRYLREDNQDCTRRVQELCDELLRIFDRVSTADGDAEAKRVLAPLFSTTGKLLAEGLVPDAVFSSLFDRAFAAVRKSRDIVRLTSAVPVFIGLLLRPGEVRRKSVGVLLLLLGFSYPTVRQATAKALYIRLLEEDGNFDLSADGSGREPVPAEAIAAVSELISVTPWGTDSEEVLRTALREVYGRLGLDLPAAGRSIVCQRPEDGKGSKAGGQYADLVREAHF